MKTFPFPRKPRELTAIGGLVRQLRENILHATEEQTAVAFQLSLADYRGLEMGRLQISPDLVERIEEVTGLSGKILLFEYDFEWNPVNRGRGYDVTGRDYLYSHNLATIYKELDDLAQIDENSKLRIARNNALPKKGRPVEKVAEETREILGISIEASINIFNLLDGELNIRIVPYPLGSNTDFDGHFNDTPTTGEYILINCDKPVSRIAFTLGHEFAHMLFGHKEEEEGDINYNSANSFSANFLMPKQLVEKCHKQLPNDDIEAAIYIVKLADSIFVSPKALLVQLSKLYPVEEIVRRFDELITNNTALLREMGESQPMMVVPRIPNHLNTLLKELAENHKITPKSAKTICEKFENAMPFSQI